MVAAWFGLCLVCRFLLFCVFWAFFVGIGVCFLEFLPLVGVWGLIVLGFGFVVFARFFVLSVGFCSRVFCFLFFLVFFFSFFCSGIFLLCGFFVRCLVCC